jgi:YD repeat-containing protein
VIALPEAGGGVSDVLAGAAFRVDLFTGAGSLTVPLATPPGRNGVQPRLALEYHTGAGNGPFGFGWRLSLPEVTRTAPRSAGDATGPAGPAEFRLGGTELVPVAGGRPGRMRYRSRAGGLRAEGLRAEGLRAGGLEAEGLPARIEHVTEGGDFWAVRTGDGLLTRYGVGASAVVRDPTRPDRIVGWRISETRDAAGNLVRYGYSAASGRPLLSRVSYVDYGDPADPGFLVRVDFDYEPVPDTDRPSGPRCRTIRVSTHASDGVQRMVREYRLAYRAAGVPLLSRVDTVGIDGDAEQALPPLAFGYTTFDPARGCPQPVSWPRLAAGPAAPAAQADPAGGWPPGPNAAGAVHPQPAQLGTRAGAGRAALSRPAGATPDPTGLALPAGPASPRYLLSQVDNGIGARTRVYYRPSTADFRQDRADPATRWRTPPPAPVPVVGKVETVDAISGDRRTSEYRYRHGTAAGFGLVEELDTEPFAAQPAGADAVPARHYAAPLLTRHWFHAGPVPADRAAEGDLAGRTAEGCAGSTDGCCGELDLTGDYWPGEPALPRPDLPAGADRWSALRALQGIELRTETYGLDGTDRAGRPYTVTEVQVGLSTVGGVATPLRLAERTSDWERGDEPMTRFSFSAGHDGYGAAAVRLEIAVPRGPDRLTAGGYQPYLATATVTEYARRDDADHYRIDRVARRTRYAVGNDGRCTVPELRDAVLAAIAGESTSDGVALHVIGHHRTYYDGAAFVGLPLGELGRHGRPARTETLRFTDAFLAGLGGTPGYLTPGAAAWTIEYPAEFRELTPALAGYRHYAAADVPGSAGGYYAVDARCEYSDRGLLLTTVDAAGAATTIEYDEHELLPVRCTDAVGLVTAAVPDHRVLRPRELTDPNGNTSTVTFSPAGLVAALFHGSGDRTEPSIRIAYDLGARADRGEPVSIRTTRRVHHDTDTAVAPGERDKVLVTVEYIDGFGRTVQTRSLAGDIGAGGTTGGAGGLPIDPRLPVPGLPVPGLAGTDLAGTDLIDADLIDPAASGPSTSDAVLVSGWQEYDNKGRLLRQYEPFVSSGYAYHRPGADEYGTHVTRQYDPRGRLVRTVHPDGSEERVVFGVPADLADPDTFAPTPWQTYRYDQNDNAGRTHPLLPNHRGHWDTPSVRTVDALGRTVVETASGTRSTYDLGGNLVSTVDAQGAETRYRHDLAGHCWRVDEPGGWRRTVRDVRGAEIESRDGTGALRLHGTDRLGRSVRTWSRADGTGAVTLRQRTDYGDAGSPDQPAAQRQAARAVNLLGRPTRQYGEAGVLVIHAADRAGNVLRSTRRVIADAPDLATLLDPTEYTCDTRYDALGRQVWQLTRAGTGGRRELLVRYNAAGRVARLTVDGTVQVRQTGYDAHGRRTVIAYGDGSVARYAYHPLTGRLARLRIEQPDHPQGTVRQDSGYRYDLAGNLLIVQDFRRGSDGSAGPTDRLVHGDDALGELVRAAGDSELAGLFGGQP